MDTQRRTGVYTVPAAGVLVPGSGSVDDVCFKVDMPVEELEASLQDVEL